MLKLLPYASIFGIALFTTGLHAESIVTCPQYMKCVVDQCTGNRACHLPAGFKAWKVYSPFEKSSGRFIFYQSVYSNYPNVTTLTCRYGDSKGPYLILDHANNHKPLLENSQWIKRDDFRYICNAAYPKHCSFHAE